MLRELPAWLQKMLEERSPMGVGETVDIAGIVAFLASDQARWITNEKIRGDGGIR
jgi:NAD(P)-dependent dehydrogenase (short-subunit alcohol dehydrogenase family)